MTAAETTKLVAILKAAFPRQVLEAETVQVYATFLSDLEWGIAEGAVKGLIARSRFFPTIAEIREAVAESACGLPGEVEAWELVNRYVFAKRGKLACPGECDDGLIGEELDTCPSCHGNGYVRERRAPLPPEVHRAMEYVGGEYGIREADKLAVIRAQFRDAYRGIRTEEVTAIAVNPQLALDRGERLRLTA